MRRLIFLIIVIGSIYVLAKGDTPTGPSEEFAKVQALAIETLNGLQPRSIENSREYCGDIVEIDGVMQVTEITEGDHDSCTLEGIDDENVIILASFHTHGGHDPDYESEVPSTDDYAGSDESDVYEFVSTPGGRVWLIDPFQDEMFLICGVGCVYQDPNYDPSDHGDIPDELTLKELEEILE